jgi:hypothetical protein
MIITANKWKNKKDSNAIHCKCNSWKQHWINATRENALLIRKLKYLSY